MPIPPVKRNEVTKRQASGNALRIKGQAKIRRLGLRALAVTARDSTKIAAASVLVTGGAAQN